MVWVFVSPKNLYVEILTCNDDGDRRYGFGRWLGHGAEPSWMGIGAQIKQAPGKASAPPTMWGHSEKALVMNQEEDSYQTMQVIDLGLYSL